MNRRLFINQVSVGLALPFLPFSAFGQDNAQATLDSHTVAQITKAIQQGAIGSIQQIGISHTYSPELLTMEALLRMAQQDINACLTAVGLPSFSNSQLVQQISPAPLFGSCAADLKINTIQITWQALARFDTHAKPVSCQIRLFGSQGVLQTIGSGTDYQIRDLTGRSRKQVSSVTSNPI